MPTFPYVSKILDEFIIPHAHMSHSLNLTSFIHHNNVK
jgi:hypothetical protein